MRCAKNCANFTTRCGQYGCLWVCCPTGEGVRRSAKMRPRPRQVEVQKNFALCRCPSLSKDAASAARQRCRGVADSGVSVAQQRCGLGRPQKGAASSNLSTCPSLSKDAASAATDGQGQTCDDRECPSLSKDAASAAPFPPPFRPSCRGVRRSAKMRPRPRWPAACRPAARSVRRSAKMRPRPRCGKKRRHGRTGCPSLSKDAASAAAHGIAAPANATGCPSLSKDAASAATSGDDSPSITPGVRRSAKMRPRPRAVAARTKIPHKLVSVAQQRCGLGRRIGVDPSQILQPRCPSLSKDAASAARYRSAAGIPELGCPSLSKDAASAALSERLDVPLGFQVSVAQQRCGLGRIKDGCPDRPPTLSVRRSAKMRPRPP